VQILWIPFWAAGVVNGVGHWWGYRNGETREHSRNFLPIGLWIGGEELHNNHHLAPASPKLSRRWWEFDIGWFWICILRFFKLAKLQVK
jgi:stearoyl-CoA desaturase (delta-9 desaturase)